MEWNNRKGYGRIWRTCQGMRAEDVDHRTMGRAENAENKICVDHGVVR